MAKHVILESYAFTPSTGNIVVTGKSIRQEQLLLVTNVTRNVVMYNFSDSTLGAAIYNQISTTTGQETTTIQLTGYSTSAMSTTDKLSILYEETYTEMIPAETYRDPVDKLRTSTPQSLIDTDFEYGVQPTKWESTTLLNNRPSAFYDPTITIALSAISVSTKTVTITTAAAHGLSVGTPFFLQGTLDAGNADGWWITETGTTGSTIVFTCINAPASTLYDANKTYFYPGTFYTGSAIPAATTAFTYSSTTVTATTTYAHGLQPGDSIYVVGTTGPATSINSSYIVQTTPTNNSFTITVGTAPSTTITAVLNASIYPRIIGYVQHRAFDGGVQFSNVQPYHGYQVIRQTRRQFRYQSGKGIQFSTGSILKPSVQVDGITSVGTTVTVTTKFPHGLQPGAALRISGANETAYNGVGVAGGSTYVVVTAPTPLTFTYTAASTPSGSPATGFPLVINPQSWYGSSNRIGMFDSQNGFFYEFDGQTIYACLRNSTTQTSGNVSVTAGSPSVTGSATKFSSELKPGDAVVIRGQTYFVQTIASDTQMYVYPEYRGATNVVNAQMSKIITTRYPQSAWNIDKMDGTGASLMTLDLGKMQMFYMDFTWYGAGAVRFGFKNNRGEVIFCHRIPNNNINTEAYIRSGNLVARYETSTIPYYTYITASVPSSAGSGSTISVADCSLWPSTGTVILTQAAATGAVIEYITYTAKVGTTGLVIGSRAQAQGYGSATTFTYSATAPIQAQLYAPQQASTISHWGSSVIMDGRFDDDKSFVFNAGFNTALTNLTQNTRVPLMTIRVGPSVDSGQTGLLGTREIINRMQLTLRSMDSYCGTTPFRIDLVLNGKISSGGGNFSPVGGSSLAQIAYHVTSQTITGGESIYGFFTNANATTSQDLNLVRDIGNSILGGGLSLTPSATANGIFPDGPDVITICATAIGGNTNTINARISWTEAQA